MVYPLPRIGTVVYALGVVAALQCGIDAIRPRRPPFLGFGLLVPVGSRYGFAFILTLFRVIDFVPVPVENVLLFLLRAPFAALFKGAHGQHDMGVRVAAILVMYADVGAHSSRHKMPVDVLAEKASSISLASWAFFAFLILSTAFHKTALSVKPAGAWAGSKISVWTSPPLRV